MDLRLPKRATAVLLAPALLLSLAPAFPQASPAPGGEKTAGPELPVVPLADYQEELLTIAIEGVNGFPRHVQHDKNRSRAQDKIVRVCLELGQLDRALEYTELITNWRRGAGYAACAEYLARKGEEARARELLELAHKDLMQAVQDGEQEWRCETIQALMGSSFLLLEDIQGAVPYLQSVSPAQYDPIAVTSAWQIDPADFRAIVEEQESLPDADGFAVSQASLRLLAEFYTRFYADEERRAFCEEKALATMERGKLPVEARYKTFAIMIEAALEHGDAKTALRLVESLQLLVEATPWQPGDQVRLTGRLAGYRFRAGDEERAVREANNALEFFDEHQELIYDIFRAEALSPLAEAWVEMGDREKALEVYRRAIEEGARNPNSRPRAEDLSETLCSMALHEVEPDEALWKRIREIQKGLGDPW